MPVVDDHDDVYDDNDDDDDNNKIFDVEASMMTSKLATTLYLHFCLTLYIVDNGQKERKTLENIVFLQIPFAVSPIACRERAQHKNDVRLIDLKS